MLDLPKGGYILGAVRQLQDLANMCQLKKGNYKWGWILKVLDQEEGANQVGKGRVYYYDNIIP